MKKYLILLLIISGVVSACSNDTENDSGEENPAQESDADSTDEENAEEPETNELEEVTSENLIDEAINQYGDTASYEMRYDYTISTESEDDEDREINMITTYSEADELKLDVNTPAETVSHYMIDGEHFIYDSGELELQEDEVDTSNSSYGDLVTQLEDFKDGEIAESDEGYMITIDVSSVDDLSNFIPESLFEDVSNSEVEGTVMIHFNQEYQFDGSDIELTVEDSDGTYTLTGTGTISRIGDIDTIDKPDDLEE